MTAFLQNNVGEVAVSPCYDVGMKKILQIVAWLLIGATTFATLGPPELRPHSALGQDGEHALAFVLVGLAVGAAYHRRPLMTALIAIALTGVVELLQFFAPGRHARIEDFIVDALTLCIGLSVSTGLRWAIMRRREPTVPAQ